MDTEEKILSFDTVSMKVIPQHELSQLSDPIIKLFTNKAHIEVPGGGPEIIILSHLEFIDFARQLSLSERIDVIQKCQLRFKKGNEVVDKREAIREVNEIVGHVHDPDQGY